jgi:hypothetical protein
MGGASKPRRLRNLHTSPMGPMGPLIDKLSDTIWETVRGLSTCGGLTIGQSSLINNNEWKKIAAKST